MSKKKATMTLKDFHGGSIPSDLPLPSAPGVTVRPVDRSGFDRQMSWGSSAGRSDHRLRPTSAGSVRNLDEKTPFLSHSSHIGRNFDEDERKPLDGVSGPRRTVADENFRAQPSRMADPKIDNRVGHSVSSPANQISSGSMGNSYAGRVVEVHNSKFNNQIISGSGYGSNYPTMGGNSGQAVTGTFPNVWGLRKETGVKEPGTGIWSAPDAETKLAHASALEKVSSGRWNSKHHVHPPKDAASFGRQETEGEFGYNANNVYNTKTYNRLEVASTTGYQDSLVMHAERSLAVSDGIHGGGKEVSPTYERARSTHVESYERNISVAINGLQSPNPTAKPDGTGLQAILPSESSERPKLKLLPRSKPLENSVLPVDQNQRYEQTSVKLHLDSCVVHEVKNPVESAIVVGDRAPDRPKLNLKLRSQPPEQLEGNSEVKRGTVFGKARPREMVLKARGVEDDVSNFEDQIPLRMKEAPPKADTFTHALSARYSEKSDTIPSDPRVAKYSNRRDHQVDGERTDPHRRNWKNDNWRNNRDAEKHHSQQQLQDRPPSPDTWRKPVEHPASSDAPVRYGKAASAVELAQAFSKSVSGPTVARLPGPRGIPGRTQIPFSRLTGPTPRPQINGY